MELLEKSCLKCGKKYRAPNKYWYKRRKYCSISCSRKGKVGSENNHWAGDKIQKDSIHSWIAKILGKPKRCEICGTTTAKRYDWSNKNHTYKRNPEDWQRLCKRCHLYYDIKNNGYTHYIFGKQRKLISNYK